MKNSEVNNKHKNKSGELKAILLIWYFKHKIFLNGRLMKHKAILCSHGGMKQLLFNYWEANDPVVNWISVRIIIAIASIYEYANKPI